mmetsp:Transcript_16232/g.30911  ORF Transcript_16232/g.30911 Transcript_16232/m.30911 type:complete len:81 (+) Transcript_16232:394-636(+)
MVESEEVIKFIATHVGVPLTGDDEGESSSSSSSSNNDEIFLYPAREAERVDRFIQVFEGCIQGCYEVLTGTDEAQVKAGK